MNVTGRSLTAPSGPRSRSSVRFPESVSDSTETTAALKASEKVWGGAAAERPLPRALAAEPSAASPEALRSPYRDATSVPSAAFTRTAAAPTRAAAARPPTCSLAAAFADGFSPTEPPFKAPSLVRPGTPCAQSAAASSAPIFPSATADFAPSLQGPMNAACPARSAASAESLRAQSLDQSALDISH